MKKNRISDESAAVLARKVRFMIRVLWLFSGLAWVILWLLYAMNERASFIILSVVMLVTLAGCFILGRVLTRLIQAREEAEDLRETLESAEAINRDLRAQRHDVINHLQVVYSLLQLGDQAEALDYMEKLNQDFVSSRAVLRTDDAAVNALLQAKMIQGRRRGLRMEMEIRTGLEGLPMESWEFCRVLGNLLDNAMDAADEAEEGTGFVRLRLWTDPDAFSFSVSNNGAGILPEHRERVFQPGFTTKGDNGTGMGLYIVRSLVEEAGGRILLESGKGETVFVGSIPAAAPASADPA